MSIKRISLYVDDERRAPKGWTPAKSYREAIDYFEVGRQIEIVRMSLDWHLGDRAPDGIALAEEMIGRVYWDELPIWRNLELVLLHSSDDYMAKQQKELLDEGKRMGAIPASCRIEIDPINQIRGKR